MATLGQRSKSDSALYKARCAEKTHLPVNGKSGWIEMLQRRCVDEVGEMVARWGNKKKTAENLCA